MPSQPVRIPPCVCGAQGATSRQAEMPPHLATSVEGQIACGQSLLEGAHAAQVLACGQGQAALGGELAPLRSRLIGRQRLFEPIRTLKCAVWLCAARPCPATVSLSVDYITASLPRAARISAKLALSRSAVKPPLNLNAAKLFGFLCNAVSATRSGPRRVRWRITAHAVAAFIGAWGQQFPQRQPGAAAGQVPQGLVHRTDDLGKGTGLAALDCHATRLFFQRWRSRGGSSDGLPCSKGANMLSISGRGARRRPAEVAEDFLPAPGAVTGAHARNSAGRFVMVPKAVATGTSIGAGRLQHSCF